MLGRLLLVFESAGRMRVAASEQPSGYEHRLRLGTADADRR
jgi:hypothetical protein